MPLRAIFYDTETTGVSTKNDLIVEIAAYDPERDVSFEQLINPGIPIPPSATGIHHITDAMVSQKPSFKEVAQDFLDFCDGDVVLIAHNNDQFDQPLLEAEFSRHNLSFPNWKFLDSLKWARRYRPDLPRHSLQVLRENYGFPANNAHRALDDVITLHRVFDAMVDDLSIDTIYELLNVSQFIQIMPFGKYKGKPLQVVPPDYIQWLKSNGALDKNDNKDLKSSFEKLGLLTTS
ncbi:MAG: 3'-5' exonuclease DinG [Chlamydiae bacterium]|nr:3'-5' exonuclease DinG [Chlamydiota bacterium]